MFAEKSRATPADAVERIVSVDYHPRAHSLRSRWLVGCAAIVAGVATATVALTGRPQGNVPLPPTRRHPRPLSRVS